MEKSPLVQCDHFEMYARSDGARPVSEFIEKQSETNQAKIFAEFDDLVNYGLDFTSKKLKRINDTLWVLRFRGEGLRFGFFFFFHGDKVVFLHGFTKTRGMLKRELSIATYRLEDYLATPDQEPDQERVN